MLKDVANKLVDFHGSFKEMVKEPNRRFEEQQPYAAISIRELLQVVQHLRALMKRPGQLLGLSPSETTRKVAFEVWCTYGSRFRRTSSRSKVQELIQSIWGSFSKAVTDRLVISSQAVSVGMVSLDFDGMSLPRSRRFAITTEALRSTKISTASGEKVSVEDSCLLSYVSDGDWRRIAASIRQCIERMSAVDFMRQYGVYPGFIGWHTAWLSSLLAVAETNRGVTPGEIASLGACCYVSRLRHPGARDDILSIFASAFGTKPSTLVGSASTIKLTISAERPIALTTRLVELWQELLRGVRVQLPLLVAGPTGCGKTAAITVLAELLHCPCFQAYLTPETDSSLLVGSYRPCVGEGSSQLIDWQDGIVTEAIDKAGWVLLDNISDADPCVLERLNPLLEQDVYWVVTEKGDTEKADMSQKQTFRVLATMTVGGDGRGARGNELSPALSNRFNAVFMPAVPIDTRRKEDCMAEFKALAGTLLGVGESEADDFAAVCWAMWEGLIPPEGSLKRSQLVEPFAFRNVVRFLDSTYRLKAESPQATWPSCLLAAFEFSVGGQFIKHDDSEAFKRQLSASIRGIFGNEPAPSVLHLDLAADPYHILTQQRMVYAKRLHAAAVCNFPVLLEGPAAVGKTSLVDMLARNWRKDSKNGRRERRLERVNNTQTTTINDYFGSYGE